MNLPPLLGNLDQPNFFLYTACDTQYFDEFAPALINSVLKNTKHGLHLHLYNPTAEQIARCRSTDRVSMTYEQVPIEYFDLATKRWQEPLQDPELVERHRKTLNAMTKGNDVNLQQRMQRTYFACARFVRLAQLIRPTHTVFAMDCDALVRKPFPLLDNLKDLYIHHITGRRARFLAGGIYLANSRGYDFVKEYASVLQNHIEADNLYWSIDQDTLDQVVPKYRWDHLPISYIDWDMQPSSFVWTAKGTRKNLETFVNEKRRYMS